MVRTSLARLVVAVAAVSLSASLAAEFVYVVNNGGMNGSSNVLAYSIGATGALPLIGSGVATGVNPQSLTVDATGRFVYVANFASGDVSAYSVDAMGALTP